MFATDARLAAIPFMGAGIGYRTELDEAIMRSRDAIDFVEIITDNFINDARKIGKLRGICDVFAVVLHGVGLSVGSVRLDGDYLHAIKTISDITGAPYYSEHLAISQSPEFDLGDLAPLWYTEESLAVVIRNVRQVQEVLEKPLVLETITYLFEIPNGSMSQTEFFGRLTDATGCGILLDVTNVRINAANHAFDPEAFLRAMPLDRVVQVHLAGGYWNDGLLVDGHSRPVDSETWALLDTVAALIPIKAAILEHDTNFPDDFSVLLHQVARAREVVARRDRSSPTPDGMATARVGPSTQIIKAQK